MSANNEKSERIQVIMKLSVLGKQTGQGLNYLP